MESHGRIRLVTRGKAAWVPADQVAHRVGVPSDFRASAPLPIRVQPPEAVLAKSTGWGVRDAPCGSVAVELPEAVIRKVAGGTAGECGDIRWLRAPHSDYGERPTRWDVWKGRSVR